MRNLLAAFVGALALATSTHAAVSHVGWRVVAEDTLLWNRPYTGSPQDDTVEGANWASTTRVTCDLYLHGTPGQGISAIHMGDASSPGASPFALRTNGTVFNHSLGADVQSLNEGPPLHALAYDTFVDMGGTASAPTISFLGGADLSGSGGVLRASWFTDDGAALDGDGRMRLLRVTLGFAPGFNPWFEGGYLGTPGLPGQESGVTSSSLQVTLAGGETVTLVIGNAIYPPAPGAAALFAVAGAAGVRRRR